MAMNSSARPLPPQDEILKLQSSRLRQQLDFENRHAERQVVPDDVLPVSARSSGVSRRDSPSLFGPQRSVLVRTLSFDGESVGVRRAPRVLFEPVTVTSR
jgi:hypothetical protein